MVELMTMLVQADILENVIVHDASTCSTHVPIQVHFKVQCKKSDNYTLPQVVNKIVWKDEKLNEYKQLLNCEIEHLNIIVNQIMASDIDINCGIETFAHILYTCAFSVFGVTQRIDNNKRSKPKRKNVVHGPMRRHPS